MKSNEVPLVAFPERASKDEPGGVLPLAENRVERPQFAEYLRIVQRHKMGILILALLGALVGLFRAMSAVPMYQASLTMLVQPVMPESTSNQRTYYPVMGYLFYETQYDVIRSRAVAERAVDKLGLHLRPQSAQKPELSMWRVLLEKLGIRNPEDKTAEAPLEPPRLAADADATGLLTGVGITPKPPSELEAQQTARRNSLVGMVRGGLQVDGGKRSQIIVIRYSSADPKLAAEVANAVADAYADIGLESRLDETRRATSWLTERIDELRTKVADSEAALQAFQAREGLVGTDRLRELTSSRLATLNKELVAAQARYAEQSKRYGNKHPKMIAAKAELGEARARLRRESSQVVGAQQKEFELSKLEREVATNRELYETFLQRFKKTDIASTAKNLNVRVIDRARVPGGPYAPNKKKMVLTSLFMGLLLGVGLAVLREQLDNTFKTSDDIEEKLGLPVLGILPLLDKTNKASAPERFYIGDSRSSFAEAVNHIRTGVLFSDVDQPPQVILVTSSIQSEGKTTLSSNLALGFSQLGRTLLIDADLRKPRVAKVTGLDKERGLVEVVAGTIPLKDCIVKDKESPNLYILKSGTIPPNPLELISSSRFASLLAELRKNFDHIVIDTAPLLPVSDGIVLGHITDGVIMVLHAGRTTHAMAREAAKRLRAANVRPLGVVLSQLAQKKFGYHYGDYHYAGYYYGYGNEPAAKT